VFILGAILLLSVLIIVHEFGHYIFAVATGMRVDRFSVIGIGPPVLHLFNYKGTEFVISAIPFGAYVHIVGMETPDEEELREEERARAACLAEGKEDETKYLFRNRPLYARVLTILGGPLANYLAAMVIFFGVYTVHGAADRTKVVLSNFADDDTPAEQSGLQPGDQFINVDGESVQGSNANGLLVNAIQSNAGKTVAFTVLRGGEEQSHEVAIPEKGVIGIGLTHPRISVGAYRSATTAIKAPFIISRDQLTGLASLVRGKSKAEVGGPVAIVHQISKSAQSGWVSFFLFGGMISTVLGMFNLLPIPALDGGRLVFLGYEMVARRPANRKVEEMIHGIGMLALLGLIALVTIRDIGKLVD